MAFKAPNKFRVRTGTFASPDQYGANGMFILPNPFTRNGKPALTVIASDGQGWEHVSVSTEFRCPTWAEMCHVKATFWDAEDAVVQFHPPKLRYVNHHKFCLHLWRPVFVELPLPALYLV